jgi:CRP/FNR family transcriptional regulator/CRP/FNR family cyclic AMP-dependent transcriptional regulator
MQIETLEQMVAGVPMFGGLSSDDVERLCSVMHVRNYSTGDDIVCQDDEDSQTFYTILSGRVHVAVITSEGKQAVLATLKSGDFFGEMSLFDKEPRSASVIAAEACEVAVLYRRDFFDILEHYPKIAIQVIKEMSKRLRHSNRHINTLSMMSVYGRVAEVLLDIAREQGIQQNGMTVIPARPTHQVIADMAATSRETVTRILSQLQKKRYIAIHGKSLVILDEKKLYD